MNRRFLAIFVFLSLTVLNAIPLYAQGSNAETNHRMTELLWPDGPPDAGGKEEGDLPRLIITQVASEVPTAAVVILPGGGYHGHAMEHEGYQFADWFAAIGIQTAICTYRLRGKGNDGKGYGHPSPMQDAQRAILHDNQIARMRICVEKCFLEQHRQIGFSNRLAKLLFQWVIADDLGSRLGQRLTVIS